MELISIKNLYFNYQNGNGYVLNDFNLKLKKAERLGITGPNGSGKTTLFYLIMGLLQPEKGSINIFDKQRNSEEDFKEVRKRIGLLFQDSDSQLFSPTVEEDISFGLFNLGLERKDIREKVDNILDRLDMARFRLRPVHKLSYGEKRLIALSTVIVMNPEVLLLDEPTMGLDDSCIDKIKQVLKETADTYIIISHDKEFLADTTETIKYF